MNGRREKKINLIPMVIEKFSRPTQVAADLVRKKRGENKCIYLFLIMTCAG